MSRWAALRTLARAIGWRDALLYGAARVLGTASGGRARLYKYRLVAQPVPAREAPARRTRFEVRRAVAQDVLGLLPRPADVIERRFGAGAQCVAAYRDGDFAGCIWFVRGDYDEDEVRCRFRPSPPARTAWDFDVYVPPRHRLGFAFATLWQAVEGDLRRAGVQWTLSRISAFNPASLGAHRRLGARALGSATFLCVGRAQCMLSTVAPYVHVSWSPRRVPLLRLHVPDAERAGA